MTALLLVGTVIIALFPFFTYAPSSGLFLDALPQVLFFSRLVADIAGRSAPRFKRLSIASPRLLLAIASGLAATLPLAFVYLKANQRYLNDLLAVGAS